MTSSQPVVTPNAINFTPDNKRAYAFSGVIGVTNSKVNMIQFDVNSEYITAKIYLSNSSGASDDFRYEIEFNDVVVVSSYRDEETGNRVGVVFKPQIVIPPFTNVKITAVNISSGSGRNHTAHVYGKAVGMTDTGFQ